MCLGGPYFLTACSRALFIHPALRPSSGVTDMTLREKWSITTQICVGHNPQHLTSVVSIDQTWFGYHAGIDLASSIPSVPFFAVGLIVGVGFCRMLRTVEAEMNMFSKASWLAIRTRPQLTLDLAISQTRATISVCVLLAGIRVCLSSWILCSRP